MDLLAVTKWLGMPWPVTVLVFAALAVCVIWLVRALR